MNNKKVRISVVIPYFKGLDVIGNALLSVESQTEPPDEIVIVDDGSPRPLENENLPEISIPVKIVRIQNSGQSHARNVGVAHSSFEQIAFLDQDDTWKPTHLARLSGVTKGGSFFVFSNYDVFHLDGYVQKRALLNPQISSEDMALKRDLSILPSTLMVDRESFLRIGGFDEKLSGYEDDDLIVRLVSAGIEGFFSEEATAEWHHSIESSSRSLSMKISRKAFVRKHFSTNGWSTQCALLGRLAAPEVLATLRGQREALKNVLAWIKNNLNPTPGTARKISFQVFVGTVSIMIWYVSKEFRFTLRKAAYSVRQPSLLLANHQSKFIYSHLLAFVKKLWILTRRIILAISRRKFSPTEIQLRAKTKLLIRSQKSATVRKAEFYGTEAKREGRSQTEQISLSEHSLIMVMDVLAVGRSDFLFSGKEILYDISNDPAKYVSVGEVTGHFKYLTSSNLMAVSLSKPRKKLKRAIHLLSEGNGNYAHFVVETLTKVFSANELNLDTDIPFLVDGWIAPRLKALLELVNNGKREILFVSEFEVIHVEELFRLIGPNHAAHKTRTPNQVLASSYEIDPESLVQLSHAMRRISFQHRKVYLRRGKTFLDKHMYNSGRHVVNEEKLIDVLQKYGFEILDPLALGQDETRKILGETEHLITPIGASLINCIYLAAGAQVSTFSPWYKGANFDYYRQITSALNLRFSVVLGSLVDKKTDDPAHSRFRISERNLISHLEQAGYRPK